MKLVSKDKLETISGGESYVTGPVINAIVSIIKLVKEAGYDLGSGFRRMAEGEVCPLK